MAFHVPAQIRAVDPYSSYNSDNVNALTRIISKGMDVISHGLDVDINNGTSVILKSGVAIKDDAMINIIEDNMMIDLTDPEWFVETTAMVETTAKYYVVMDYIFTKTSPAPSATIKILKTRPNFSERYMFIKCIDIVGGVATTLYDFDPDNETIGRRGAAVQMTVIESVPGWDISQVGQFYLLESGTMIVIGGPASWVYVPTQLGAVEYTSVQVLGSLPTFVDSQDEGQMIIVGQTVYVGGETDWVDVSGGGGAGGDVVGPASATADAIAVFNSTSGTLIKDGITTISILTSAIGVNTAKVGITGGQASAIVTNTAKVGVTVEQQNVQSDWDATTGDALILNKPAIGGGGTGDVVGPASAVNNRVAVFNSTTGKLIKDGGFTIAEISGGGASGDVVGPSSAVDTRIATFDGTSGKLIQDSGVTMTDIVEKATSYVADDEIAVFDGTSGKLIQGGNKSISNLATQLDFNALNTWVDNNAATHSEVSGFTTVLESTVLAKLSANNLVTKINSSTTTLRPSAITVQSDGDITLTGTTQRGKIIFEGSAQIQSTPGATTLITPLASSSDCYIGGGAIEWDNLRLYATSNILVNSSGSATLKSNGNVLLQPGSGPFPEDLTDSVWMYLPRWTSGGGAERYWYRLWVDGFDNLKIEKVTGLPR